MTETRASYETLIKVAEIIVPDLPPASGSPNSRVHWAVRARERKAFMATVGLTCLAYGLGDMRLPWAKVEYEYVVAEKRRRDADNGMARGKPILDALVDLGVIQDDDGKHLDLCVPQYTVDPVRAPATIVRIWRRDAAV